MMYVVEYYDINKRKKRKKFRNENRAKMFIEQISSDVIARHMARPRLYEVM